jgi:hypothetical protein
MTVEVVESSNPYKVTKIVNVGFQIDITEGLKYVKATREAEARGNTTGEVHDVMIVFDKQGLCYTWDDFLKRLGFTEA